MPEPPRKLILRNSLCPGDIVMLTAAVRDLHRHCPGRFLTDVRTPYPELWEHNPFLTRLSESDPDVTVLRCHYPLVNRSNETPSHCLHGFIEFLNERLNLNLRPTAFKGDLYVSDLEKSWYSQVEELTGTELPFWILAAGGKRDYTIKWWDRGRYQQVVDALRGRILFVQVGHQADYHPPLRGVIDLRGRTDLRQLVRLVYHSQGVVCPVTSLMHLAAAIETPPHRPPARPCVVIAGAREPPHWEAYPHHQFIHNVGTLACCAEAACWRSRTLPLGDGDRKDQPRELCLDVVNQLPRCMHQITAAEVTRRVELYFQGGHGLRYLTAAEAKVAEATIQRLEAKRRPIRKQVPTNDGSPPRDPAAPRTRPRARRPRPPVTICVLTYGDYPRLARRCLESIRRHCDRRDYRLVVGGNAVSARTRKYLTGLQEAGAIDQLWLSPVNLYKNPMMRRMFTDIDTEFIWWFDDDSYVTQPGALTLWLRRARRSAPSAAVWGHVYFYRQEHEFNYGADVQEFVRTAPWYRGRPLPSETPRFAPGASSTRRSVDDAWWWFVTGGCWLARTAAIRALDWPDRRLLLPAEDVFFGEAIRQQGWRIVHLGASGVAINEGPTRWRNAARLMRQQMGGLKPPGDSRSTRE